MHLYLVISGPHFHLAQLRYAEEVPEVDESQLFLPEEPHMGHGVAHGDPR